MNPELLRYRSTSFWQKACGKSLYAMFELYFWFFLWRWNHGRVHGDLPDTAVVLTPNHGSYLDWLLLDVICRRKFRRPVTFLAKRKVVRNPLWRAVTRECEAIVFDENSRAQAVTLAVKVLSHHNGTAHPIVCIFPEGTRSRDGCKRPVFGGAGTVARKANASIVPVALCGFWDVWPPHKRLPFLKSVGLSVHFLQPLHPNSDADDMTLMREAINRAYEVVLRECAEKTGASQ